MAGTGIAIDARGAIFYRANPANPPHNAGVVRYLSSKFVNTLPPPLRGYTVAGSAGTLAVDPQTDVPYWDMSYYNQDSDYCSGFAAGASGKVPKLVGTQYLMSPEDLSPASMTFTPSGVLWYSSQAYSLIALNPTTGGGFEIGCCMFYVAMAGAPDNSVWAIGYPTSS